MKSLLQWEVFVFFHLVLAHIDGNVFQLLTHFIITLLFPALNARVQISNFWNWVATTPVKKITLSVQYVSLRSPTANTRLSFTTETIFSNDTVECQY